MNVAICISGGGLDGFCAGAGILLALERAGWLDAPRLDCYGTSAGSALACWLAAGRPVDGPDGLVETLRGLKDADIRDPRFLWKARLAVIDNIWQGERLRRTLHRLMPARSELRHPWHAFAVPADSAAPVDVGADLPDPPADACAASMAIPLVFPPVRLSDGRHYQDGGTACNLPLPAAPLTYDRIIVVVLTGPRKRYRPPQSVLTGALTLFQRTLAGQSEVAEHTARLWSHATVIRPCLDGRGGMLHLDHALIGLAAAWTNDAIGA